ncbi:MAG: hypothetical protein AB8I08_03845 [Sandaracinaceae bacterium]
MRRLLAFTVLPLALFGCGDPDAGKLFADMQYGTACPSSNHCEGPEDRDICGINGGMVCEGFEGVTRASCTVVEDGAGNYLLDFSVDQGLGYSLTVSQAMVPMTGGFAVGTNCSVSVSEGVNRYSASCIQQDPIGSTMEGTATPGCRLSEVTFQDDEGNPTISGRIECRDMPNQANRDLQLDVNAVGSSPTNRADPGRFRLVNCQGLEFE